MKIVIDNGHGLNTPGKRTPILPDGTQIREWQFNFPTAKKLGELLIHNGFDIVYVSDTEEDTPLGTRTTRANEAGADIFVSIHYNAFQGTWGTHGGIETYHYPNSSNGQSLAQEIQRELIQETGLRDRGVKSANFQVLRETAIPAVLCECGFMDNLEEASLMLDEAYQWKCARGIAKGICSYLGVEYQELTENENEDSPQWAIDARAWAIENDISDGSRPKDPATREEVWRMLQKNAERVD
ncbi:cell wall hydrolase/autolysin [Alkaliphilus metalliredigens QYMF]|uniref:Cell wall hydrolase/autolysin n=1 Tax=Alkaliphilus metalliredigens (strain QYMF) TaxID=293826 RepID=A6TQX4_ALKMQ|nr:N-acetylmuramoyl-L-alanine amidase [Alkaliphilus metalliredigens]ABR48592.1 cell wall hydrolase/autolysin [Alkaliphilus metalliredigens QYMF]